MVRNNNGVCYAYAYNTTKNDVEFEVQPQELIPFDYSEFLGTTSEESDAQDCNEHVEENVLTNQLEKAIQSLHVNHLNESEKEVVLGWAKDFSDIFHLNGEILSVNNKVQRRIPTISDAVIARKQFRHSAEAQEQIAIQIDKQLKSGVIRPSKSPYSSPVMIIPKEMDA